jgi:hypothetical protein
LVDLIKEEVRPPERDRFLVYNRIGDESFFSETPVLEKENIHVILDKMTLTWEFGRYNKNEEWFLDYQVVRVDGKRIALIKERGKARWEYLEELPLADETVRTPN